MGTGKTTIGKILAGRLNKEFVEMDEEVERREHRKIAAIFREDGEEHFRRLEKELLEEISDKKNLVVSCGGGLICREENLSLLKKTGIVFSLTASASSIHERTKKYAHRPLLDIDNPLKRIEELLLARAYYYNQAHYVIDTDKLLAEQVADKIMNAIEPEGHE